MKTRITIIIDFDGMSMAQLDHNVADGYGVDAAAADVIKEAVKTLAVNLAPNTTCEIDVAVSELDA